MKKKDETTWLAGQLPTAMLLCSSMKLCLASIEADCPCALQNQTNLQALNVFHAAKSVHILLQIKFHAF